jgi:hypothetical protein
VSRGRRQMSRVTEFKAAVCYSHPLKQQGDHKG